MKQEVPITKEMVAILLERVKKCYFNPADCREVIIPSDSICGVTINTPEILDLALQELLIKTQNQKISAFWEDGVKPKKKQVITLVNQMENKS